MRSVSGAHEASLALADADVGYEEANTRSERYARLYSLGLQNEDNGRKSVDSAVQLTNLVIKIAC